MGKSLYVLLARDVLNRRSADTVCCWVSAALQKKGASWWTDAILMKLIYFWL